MESFVAGFAYGATTVVVGQPFDTIKTMQQASHKKTTLPNVARQLWREGGVVPFYRGGTAMLLGGGLMRSAQFGFYKVALDAVRAAQGRQLSQSERIFGIFDYQVAIAGCCGGIGRGTVEGPFEFIKVRRQVKSQWRARDGLKGFGTTLIRNSLLFSSFVIYMDLLQVFNIDLGPFLTAGLCANLSWFTFWPLDVVKSRVQSGKYEGQSLVQLLVGAARTGELYKGLGAGLARSFIANGTSMVVYKKVEQALLERNQPKHSQQ